MIGACWTCEAVDSLHQILRHRPLMPLSRREGRLPIAELGGRLDFTAGPILSCLLTRVISAHGSQDAAQKKLGNEDLHHLLNVRSGEEDTDVITGR